MKKKTKKTSKKTKATEHESDTDNDVDMDEDGQDGKKSKRRPAIDYREFVQTWKNCDTVSEVAEHLGIARTSATAIASRLRKAGVVLKKFSRGAGQQIDVKELNKIAKED